MPAGIVEISNKDDVKFKGYVTAPANGVYPGVMLLHQEYGIDASVRYLAERFAALNYTVFVPDLFWRTTPGCELNSNNHEDTKKANELLERYNLDEGHSDITKCLKWLRETPQCNGLVSTIGFGIGGNLSYLAGLWLDIESSVCYDFHNTKIFKNSETFIRRPMLIHLSKDVFERIKLDDNLKFLENINNIKLHIYENNKQDFYRRSDLNFDAASAKNASNITEKHISESFQNPHST